MTNDTRAKVPQYKWLAQQLRGHIEAGALRPGDRLPSWSEMQRTYGVNKYTIERAQKVLADEGLLICRQGSGTYVAEPVGTRPVRKGILGLCGQAFSYPQNSSPYWTKLISGVQDEARAAGYHLLLLDDESTAGWEKADGLLITTQGRERRDNQLPVAQPCVLLLSATEGLCNVASDDADGIRQAVRHLVGLGHEKIGYIHGVLGPESEPRITAYRAAMAEAGLTLSEAWLRQMQGLPRYIYRFDFGARFTETGRENMKTWLEEGWRDLGCTALLAHNDEYAMGVIAALQEAGLRVPEDVSIVGFDGGENAARFSPPLTTVQVPLEEIGRKAVGLLLKQIESGAGEAGSYSLPVRLQTRASTAPPFGNTAHEAFPL